MQQASKSNNYHYNKKLKVFANTLRNNGTKAEACLWKYVLRAGKFQKYKFRRQRPVLNFIADFMCFDLMLVIEVDGYSHLLQETIEKDVIKTKSLEAIGFSVLRFTDEKVLHEIGNVQRELDIFLEKFHKGKNHIVE